MIINNQITNIIGFIKYTKPQSLETQRLWFLLNYFTKQSTTSLKAPFPPCAVVD